MDKKALEFLVESSKVLNSTLDIGTLLSLVYDLIVAAVDCEVCSLGRLGEKGERIEVLLAFGHSSPEVSRLTVDKTIGVMGQAVRTAKPVLINDADQIARHIDSIDRAFGTKKRSSLAVPLMRGGEVIGALEAINKETGEFTSSDVEMLTALAEQIAIALDNARLYGRVTREIKERELLYEVSGRIASSLDLNEVMGLILDCLSEVVDYDAGGIYIVDPEVTDIVCLAAKGYEPDMESRVELKFGGGIVGWVAKNVEPVIVDDVSQDDRYLNARDKTRSEIVVPLLVGDKIAGVLNLESDELAAFGQDDLNLIRSFGSQAAISIERAKLHMELLEKRRLEDELELARRIQRSFLPDVLPEIAGYELSAINLPSEEVSGDYYDVIPIAEGQWGLVIADVFGKGIPASLVMASFRASLLAEIRNNYSITTVLSKVNRLIWESVEPERCVTACYGVLDAEAGVLTYSNAGHLYPLVIGRDRLIRLDRGGMLLGAIEHTVYEEERAHLRPGDLLLLYTDGLTEAENRYGEAFGEQRLIDLAQSIIDLPASDIVKKIHHAIWDFTGAKPVDDFTLLLIKVR
jgi:sigma-B regulation protein RsbU (phosphoserine phosphatase)